MTTPIPETIEIDLIRRDGETQCRTMPNPDVVNEYAELMADGISLMEAGSGGVTAGNTIGVDNAGKGIAIAPGTATTQYLVGTALSTASAGDYFAVLFDLKNPSRAA